MWTMSSLGKAKAPTPPHRAMAGRQGSEQLEMFEPFLFEAMRPRWMSATLLPLLENKSFFFAASPSLLDRPTFTQDAGAKTRQDKKPH